MIAISWNCRGLRSLRVENAISHLVREKDLGVLFLVETKQFVDEVQDDLRYQSMLAVPSIQKSGGLAMFWKEEVNLHIQTYDQRGRCFCIVG